MKVKVTETKEYDVTPQELARAFWEMNDDDQGKFFNELSKINCDTFESQMWYARKNTSEAGRAYLRIMAGVK